MGITGDILIYIIGITGDILVYSLTGEKIHQLASMTTIASNYNSLYGEYALALTLNDLNNSEINASIKISTPSISSTSGYATDLNETNNSLRARAILTALENSSKDIQGNLKTRVNVILMDIGATNESNYTSNLVNKMDSVLLISGERFSVSDTTYTKAFKYNRNGDFKIIGSVSKNINMPNTININSLENAFDNVQSVTNIDFQPLGEDKNLNKYFCISSNKVSNLDLLQNEDNGTTLFTQIPLNSTFISDENKSFMQGAISKVYTIENLLNTKIDMNTSFLDFNTSSFLHIENQVELNIDSIGHPLSPAPYTIDDLKINPIWSIDFPTNSIIYDLAKYNKKIDIILTSQTGIGGSLFWSTTDLSKNPQDWYGNNYNTNSNFDFDNQGIFRINSNRGYWVKISDKTNIQAFISSKSFMHINITPHFYNEIYDIDSPSSIVHHDIKNKLSISFNKNFINPLDNSFYDVIALINGQKYHLRNEGSTFQLDITNQEMNLKQHKYPIILEAYDGFGNSFKETNTNHKFTINLLPPPTPKIIWLSNGELSISNKPPLSSVLSFVSYISDIESIRYDNNMDFNNTHLISRFSEKLGWKAHTNTTLYGMPKLLKIVFKNQYNLFSNILTSIYAPLKFGHILEVNETDIDNVSIFPFSFLQNKFLPINGGVQLRKESLAINFNNSKIQLAYFPYGGADKENSNELINSSSSNTMYLKVNKNDIDPIASIQYISGMQNTTFYLSYGNRLYIGSFSPSNTFSSDSHAYVLHSSYLDSINLQNDNYPNLQSGGCLIDFGSYIPSQPISFNH
jgi:hypothetical protein